MKDYEQQLTGGHPNSLGNVETVVEQVLNNPDSFDELFNGYFSEDEVVRLRVSSCMKRLAKANKDLLAPYIPRFLTEIANIDQASTQWTLAILFDLLDKNMDNDQREQSLEIMKNNLSHPDWIVLNTTMKVLWGWAQKNESLRQWLKPQFERIAKDPRKSVSGQANKLLKLY